MTTLRYRVLDLPGRGTGAFTPGLVTTPAGSSHGEVKVGGAPGTLLVPSPKPAGNAPFGNDRKTQGSYVSPDVFTPSVYVPFADNMHGQAATQSSNELPVPAVGYARAPGVAFNPQHMGGRRVIPWPRSFQRWGSLTKTPSS